MAFQTTFPEIQTKRILKFQSEYIFDGAFDSINFVRRLDEDMVEITPLEILEFPKVQTDPDGIIPPPPTNKCYFRPGSSTSSIYINDDDTPDESLGITYLEVTFTNTFCRAVSDATASINRLKSARKNASRGIRVMHVSRPDLATVADCQAVADALRDEFAKVPVNVGPIRTRTKLESGQTLLYTSPIDGQTFELTVNSVAWSILGNEFVYDAMLSYVIVKTPNERKKEAIRRARTPLTPRATIIDVE